jgi:hypothetical protein
MDGDTQIKSRDRDTQSITLEAVKQTCFSILALFSLIGIYLLDTHETTFIGKKLEDFSVSEP